MDTPTSPLADMPAHNSKTGIIAALVGLLIAGLVAGYFIGKSGTEDVTYQTATPTVSVNISNWKMYRNDEYEFEFWYPPEYAIEWLDTGEVGEELNGRSRGVRLKAAAEPREIYFSINDTFIIGRAPENVIFRESVEINELRTEKIRGYGYQILPDRVWFVRYAFGNANDSYLLVTRKDDATGEHPIPLSTEQLLESILSTFRFTK